MKIKIILFLFVIFLPTAVFAETTLKAQVEKNKITTDEALTYKLIIASTENALPAPAFPKFAGFQVLSQAQSSTVSFMRGGMKTILVYAFILAPMKVGKFKIEPASIKVRNEAFNSDAIEIEVTQGKRIPQPPPVSPKNKPSLPPGAPTQPQEPQYTL